MNITSYKCPCCGASIHYDGKIDKLSCASCGNDFDPANLKQMEEILENTVSEEAAHWDWAETQKEEQLEKMCSYSCPSCGGEIIAEQTTAATFCPYCGNATIMSGQLSGTYRPDLIIPFKLDSKAAVSALKAFYKRKFLLPKLFKDENHIQEIRGVYVPFWLYSCDATGSFRYRATRVRSWTDGRYQITETSHFMIGRGGELGFNQIPADGSKKMDDAVMNAIEPFHFSEARDFNAAYLSGFYADKFDVAAQENAEKINLRVKNTMEDHFRDTVRGYASVRLENSSVQMKNDQVQYALLPVWLLNTYYKGRRYLFAMNGQTGRLIGDLPVSRARFWGLFAGISLLAEAIILLILLLGGLLS
ncbi:MAG: hypothetical protein DBX52_02725 [Clostridiales bacterium]|nr:MAG: hypothetical protein DBX52_02725 [Clostridiales bacterium]